MILVLFGKLYKGNAPAQLCTATKVQSNRAVSKEIWLGIKQIVCAYS